MEQDSTSATSSLIRPSGGPTSTRVAALLGRRRDGPSSAVRRSAAMQLEERRADWAHSRPVVALDLSWNIAFAIVSAVMIAVTLTERPNVPVRVWVAGYAVQCVVHVVLVWTEFRRRRREEDGDEGGGRLSGQSR